MEASEIRAGRLNSKEIVTPKLVKISCSQSQMEQLSSQEEIRVSENPPQFRINPTEEKSSEDMSQPIDEITDERQGRR